CWSGVRIEARSRESVGHKTNLESSFKAIAIVVPETTPRVIGETNRTALRAEYPVMRFARKLRFDRFDCTRGKRDKLHPSRTLESDRQQTGFLDAVAGDKQTVMRQKQRAF